ncbi:hypothetical protein MPTK1_6g15250 [Marchantia polymorpha subsp. ruderalis]|uniref:OVATE domain-containing protein n=2 Tax=Marchantia polymorpha TaxID=3197 RepID=A0AAF6BS94_MARPO|nr:hypothetical protein MARPO_0056s0035 [Marchantia polymorpha]BBN14878.1 hypothetical protein Mp_6g15250 [Marchantia polymorpha subsp. ruderalis]|eukprot:PTQ37560.1 hypothetical protein MARPO_0056s0035 [Marchantia polymorpha]
MCPDKSWNLISQQVVVPTWYMKHVFRDLRGSWRCLSFAKAKHHKYKQSQADLARSLNLQRASARAAAAATSRNHNPHLQHQHQHQHHHQHNQQQLLHQHPSSSRRRSSSKSKSKSKSKSNGASADKSRWMFKSFSALYCNSEKPRFKAKDSFAKMKSLINSSFERREAALSPSSSMNELIPTTIDFDLENALLSTTEDSDIASTGASPSRRSSGSFFYPPTPETSCAGDPRHSPYQIAKHQRRKRATVIREVKNSSTSAIGAAAGGANGLALGSDAASLAARVRAAGGGGGGRGRRSSPENLSVSAVLTMDTGSCTPCRSISTAGWLENYDLMTESLSSWTPSEKASSVVDVPSCTPSQRSFSGPLPLGGGAPRRDFLHHHHHHQQQQQQQQLQQHHGIQHHKKPSSVHSFSQRPPSIASSMADFTDLPRRSVSSIPTTPHHHHHHHHHHQQHHYQPQPPSQIQQLQAPAAAARQVNTQKDFQEAIVDIILENDVNDLVDLEEFLQGYFRLNTLYQDIIQQFFNDLSNDLAHPHVSRAPTVFARLASANCKSSAAKSKSKPLGKPASSKHTSPTTTTS